jgi:uncharacterized protein (DUF433 family)
MSPSIYKNIDVLEAPAYPISEAAHYLLVPASTIRWWVTGRYHSGTAKPIIRLPHNGDGALLSFMNLVEIHVLDAIRRKHKVSLPKVRSAIQFLEKEIPNSKHPLADQQLATDGANLFMEMYGILVTVSQHGQVAMKELIEAYLKRIDRNPAGIPIRLYPFTRKDEIEGPRMVVIDPLISFGRPVLAGTGIPTAILAERFKAGESIEQLADDYRREPLHIQEAIRCELYREAA